MFNSLKKFIFGLFKDASQLQKPLEISETKATTDTPKEKLDRIAKPPTSSKKKKKR
jgi:hypothetical protein